MITNMILGAKQAVVAPEESLLEESRGGSGKRHTYMLNCFDTLRPWDLFIMFCPQNLGNKRLQRVEEDAARSVGRRGTGRTSVRRTRQKPPLAPPKGILRENLWIRLVLLMFRVRATGGEV